MIYLKLFWEFFKIGIFAVGGGMATLPFLQKLGLATNWFDQSLITDMIAISESTPGPIGINMATYVGYNVAGILGSLVATLGEVVPAVIIVCFVSTVLEKFRNNHLVNDAFYGLRPAVTGLIIAAGISVAKASIFATMDVITIIKVCYFGLIFFAIKKFKKHPIIYIAISAVVGILLKF